MENLANSVLLTYWIFYSILLFITYHKVFLVIYFDLPRGLLRELIGAMMIGGILAVASIYYWWIGLLVIAIVALVAISKINNSPLKIMILALAIIACIIVVILSHKMKNPAVSNSDPQNTDLNHDADNINDENSQDTANPENTGNLNDETESDAESGFDEPTSEQTDNISDFVLPYSNSVYYERTDIEGLSSEECRIARNEIYARHGRIFQSSDLQAYFEQFDWYEAMYDADSFDASVLNGYEKSNLDLISNYETEMGYK